MRALYLTERFPPERGGLAVSAGRQVAALAERLERLDVLRLTRDLPAGRVACAPLRQARIYSVGMAEQMDESLQLCAQTARNLHDEHEYDVFHGHAAVHAGYLAVLAARQAGRRAVVSLRGNDVDRAAFHGPRLPFLLWTLAHADALIGVSREILDKARVLAGRTEELHCVPNGVAADVFTPAGDTLNIAHEWPGAERPLLAFSGELRLKKGLPLLEDLAAHLAAARRGTLVLIGGVRRDEQQIFARFRAARPAAAARVRSLPYQDDPARLAAVYRAMDVFVFPSLWDGLPNALLEAMACAKPVLAVSIGALPEIIEDRVSGWLISPRELHRFAERALALADLEAAARAAMGERARARVLAELTPELERERILAVYERLMKRNLATKEQIAIQ
ncbi:MAG: glycosyltransferase [Vicinamibacteria bacterium]|jgi:glycosyltransferase involved in cell wall biosynthesis|nr:glycosyltransferase [Vicinamibacteria bacterium]